ncbi:hypothetical protein [Stenotrophomonas maltophilia]|uniref:hypothetical protein n=1 Tax=Stenotrophomonas maltophilia TaxID=40324 RepID=UPI0015E04919|nr:hypothetical protein [Stenotrophomonas maltophilia]MBA0362396.1 hypothetical protein [Stenotrophomonas maltophilia]
MLAAITTVDWVIAGVAAVAVFALWVANTALGECTKLRRELISTKDWIGEIERRHAIQSDDLQDRLAELDRKDGA